MKIFLLSLFALAGLTVWAIPPDSSFVFTFGGDNEYEGKCLAVDDSGYVYVGGEISNDYDSNCFLLVLNSTLQPAGSIDFGGNGYDRIYDLTLDKNYACLITGNYADSLSFGSTTLQAGSDYSLYLAKMAANGDWDGAISPYSNNSSSYGSGVALDQDENIYLTGTFNGSLSFGEEELSSFGNDDVLLAKIDPTGSLLWIVQAGGSELDMAEDVCVDSLGNCYLSGFFNRTARFGKTEITSKGDNDAFLAKLDKNGNWLWVKQFGATESDYARSLALDNDANCFFTTDSSGKTTLGSKTYDHELNGDFLLHKLDPNGNIIWTKQANLGMSSAMAVDSKGSIFVTGRCYGENSYGDKKIKSNGSEDIYFLKLDPQGNPLWLESTGGTYTDISNDLVLDKQDNCYVTGNFSGIVKFGPYERTSTHPDSMISDLFIYKIPADK